MCGLLCVVLVRCRVSYSFQGVNLSPDVETMTIEEFYNNTTLGPGDMANVFSETLRDYFQRNTPLTFIPTGGDLFLGGRIEDYTVAPVALSAADANDLNFAALTRITITVVATYENQIDPTFNFQNQRFTFFKDFDQNRQDISANERAFVDEIFERLVQDIYTASLANW